MSRAVNQSTSLSASLLASQAKRGDLIKRLEDTGWETHDRWHLIRKMRDCPAMTVTDEKITAWSQEVLDFIRKNAYPYEQISAATGLLLIAKGQGTVATDVMGTAADTCIGTVQTHVLGKTADTMTEMIANDALGRMASSIATDVPGPAAEKMKVLTSQAATSSKPRIVGPRMEERGNLIKELENSTPDSAPRLKLINEILAGGLVKQSDIDRWTIDVSVFIEEHPFSTGLDNGSPQADGSATDKATSTTGERER